MTEFRGQDLAGASFVECDLSRATIRGGSVDGMDIDDPFLLKASARSGATLLVNGVDVLPYVEQTLNERFPGRELRESDDPDGLRAAWAAVEAAWEAAVARASALPSGAVDRSVNGEYTFAETLRHLVMAIDTWLGRAIERRSDEYHPIGVPNAEYATDGYDTSVFSETDPTWERVVEVFRGHQARVRAYVDGLTDERLDEPRTHAWGEVQVTVRRCLHTILAEEWEHLRYALRDLDALAAE